MNTKLFIQEILSLILLSFSIAYSQEDNTMIFDGRIQKHTILFSDKNENGQSSKILNPEESFKIPVNYEKCEYPVKRKIRIVGGGVFPAPFTGRDEETFRRFLFVINDFLDSTDAYGEKYSLLFRGENDKFERNAFYRLSACEMNANNNAEIILPVKAKDLKKNGKNDFLLELQIYYKKQNRNPDDIYDDADSIIKISIPEGSYDWKTIKQKIFVPENIACVLFRLGGNHFSGECKFGTPQFIQNGKNLIKPFDQFVDSGRNWIGENLSGKEWPMFEFSIDENVFYSGKIFDRVSEVAEFELSLPDGIEGKHDLYIKLLKQTPSSFPYKIKEVDLFEYSKRDFEVLHVPEFIKMQSTFPVLIETNIPDCDISVSASGAIHPEKEKYNFKESGLHVMEFLCDSSSPASSISITDGKRIEKIPLVQFIEKNEDNIKISTTDDIYINRNKEEFSEYLEWYLYNGIGNAYGFRPSYQWSGSRDADPLFYKWSTNLLQKLQMPYSLMVEARSLPENKLNPDDEIISSPFYMGRQAHENDGNFYYWGHWQWVDLYYELTAKYKPFGGIFAKMRPIRTDKGDYVFFDTHKAKDMEDAANIFVNNLKNAKGRSTRHTGPSTMFKYLLMAGYDWVGAEQMYGPEEMIMSSIRGACKAYGKTDFGTHLATQWSSAPFDAPEHSTRLFLSLAISYMHGASNINTEDGLWNMETGIDRYTKSGQEHIEQQKKIYDFIQTHERRGKFVTPTAIIQGRNDAWNDFGRGNAWQQDSSIWQWGRDRESFDLLKVFSPNSKFDAIYVLKCPRAKQGWYSGTPYGPIDLLPIEASSEIMKSYNSIAFLGWNTFKEDDFKHLYDFVSDGGTLLLARPHMNTELKYELPAKLPDEKILNNLLGEGYKGLTDVTKRNIGKGKVIYFPQNIYPADPSIRPAYEKELASLGESMISSERKKGWVKGNDLIEFTAYDWNGHRTIYLLNTDWWSDTIVHQAKLLLDEKEYSVDIRRRFIEVITIKDGYAIMPEDMGTDVMNIEVGKGELIVKVQTIAPDDLLIFDKSKSLPTEYFIKSAGLHDIRIPIVNSK
jgi:hypothetical protein